MEYVFGIQGKIEVLKTKGEAHTDLAGFQQIERVYSDQNIIDNFRVVQKIKSSEDSDGNCYDWYEIDRHYRERDKTQAMMDKFSAKIDYISMMAEIEIPTESENFK